MEEDAAVKVTRWTGEHRIEPIPGLRNLQGYTKVGSRAEIVNPPQSYAGRQPAGIDPPPSIAPTLHFCAGQA